MGPLYLAIKGKSKVLISYLVNMGVALFDPDPTKVDNSPVFYAVRMGY